MDRPLDMHVPVWATSSFRWFVIAVVMSLSILGALVFEILPKTSQREKADLTPPPKPHPDSFNATNFDGVLASVKDSTAPDITEAAYRYFVRYFARLSDEDQAKFVKQVKHYSYEHYSKHANDLRGEPVKVMGLVAAPPLSMRIDPPVDGVEWVYTATVVDWDDGYLVDFLDAPPKMEKGQVVEVDGIFLKNAKYEAFKKNGKNDSGERVAPYILARRILPVKEKGPASVVEMGPVVIGIGVASVLIVLVLSFRIFRQEKAKRFSSLPISKLS